jgi:hypothetical protein
MWPPGTANAVKATAQIIRPGTLESVSAPYPVGETRPTTIEGWTVRDIRADAIVLEGPNGVRKVARGDVVPGVGRIASVVR